MGFHLLYLFYTWFLHIPRMLDWIGIWRVWMLCQSRGLFFMFFKPFPDYIYGLARTFILRGRSSIVMKGCTWFVLGGLYMSKQHPHYPQSPYSILHCNKMIIVFHVTLVVLMMWLIACIFNTCLLFSTARKEITNR